MLMEVYYEHYRENCCDKYWEPDTESIPYMVLIHYTGQRDEFKGFPLQKGFSCVSWNTDYPGILVNMELHRFDLITRAYKHSCVNGRYYTLDEFIGEVFSPRKATQKNEEKQQGVCQHGCR